MSYVMRPMLIEDIPQVSEIEREAFPTQWPPPPFKRDLNNKKIHYVVAFEEANGPYHRSEINEYRSDGNYQSLLLKIKRLFNKEQSSNRGVATRDNQDIVGYASLWFMVDEAHLTSIAVREKHRGRGIGELLVISTMNLAIRHNAQMVILEVRASNLSAQALYEKYGFVTIGVRRGYYTDNAEDAVVMEVGGITSVPYQAFLQKLKQTYAQRWGAIEGI